MTAIPSYDELPEAPEGGRSGWGVFGTDDNLGLVNLLTPERVVEAGRLIRKGSMFPLDAPVDAYEPPIASTPGNASPHGSPRRRHHRVRRCLRQLLPPGLQPVGLARSRRIQP